MFKEGCGREVIYGVADYWVSRVTWNPEEQKYHLQGYNHFQTDGHFTALIY